jgi:hypothetical protein
MYPRINAGTSIMVKIGKLARTHPTSSTIARIMCLYGFDLNSFKAIIPFEIVAFINPGVGF